MCRSSIDHIFQTVEQTAILSGLMQAPRINVEHKLIFKNFEIKAKKHGFE